MDNEFENDNSNNDTDPNDNSESSSVEHSGAEGNGIKTKKTVRIIVPVLLIILIAGVWFLKNKADSNKAADSGNPDFVLEVEEIDFEKLKTYGLPMLIDFGADGCGPCRLMHPILEKINEEWRGKVIVKFADVWKRPEAAEGYPVSVVPTQFFFDADGKPYVPSDPEGMELTMYYRKDTGEHVFTAHQGYMSETDLKKIFEEMGVEW
ncbi:MAG: thioredoxin family protein [Eubacteriales bacterium]|nr:thioredoxin family protein [Eubacteriales bacterium]